MVKEAEYFIVPLSAKTKEALKQKISDLKMWLMKYGENESFADMAYTLGCGRSHYKFRMAWVTDNFEKLLNELKKYENEDINGTGRNKLDRQKGKHIKELCQVSMLEKVSGSKLYKDMLQEIVDAYKEGYQVDFSQLFLDRKYRKISMPVYPFAKDSYWVEVKNEVSPVKTNEKRVESFLTLLDTERKNGNEKVYEKKLYSEYFYLYDHVIGNDMILPGVAYVEMGQVVGQHICEQDNNVVLSNIEFMNPVKLSGDEKEYDIRLSLEKENEGYYYQVSSMSENGQSLIHQRGALAFRKKPAQDEYINLEEVRGRCIRHITKETCYESIDERGLHLGKSFQAIQGLEVGETEVLGNLTLPEHLSNEFEQFILHPSMLDGALETVANLIKGSNSVSLPCGMKEIEVLAPLERNCYSYAVPSKEPEEQGLRKFDVCILNKQGKVLVKVKGFAFKDMGDYSTDLSNVFYFKPYWKEESIKGDALSLGEEEIVVYAGEENSMWNAVKRVLGKQLVSITKESQEELIQLLEQKEKKVAAVIEASHFDSELVDIQNASDFFVPYLETKKALEKYSPDAKWMYLYSGDVENPYHEAVSGFCKSLNLEKGNTCCSLVAVDKDSQELFAEHLLQEMNQTETKNIQVKYKGKKRYVLNQKQVGITENTTKSLYREQGVYVITGGAGSLGTLFAKEIAKKVSAHIILTGRSPLGEKQKSSLNSIRMLGAEAEYIQADITKKSDVDNLIQNIKKKYGTIHGVIHNAGIIRDAFLAQKTSDDAASVIAPKVNGTLYLDQALEEESLDFFIMTSSIAAVTGNAGQCDYAFANAFMDAFAEYRQHQVETNQKSGKTISINWPLWKDTGMSVSKEIEQFFIQTFGSESMDKDTGAQVFGKVILQDTSRLLIVKGNLEKIKNNLGLGKKQSASTGETSVKMDKKEFLNKTGEEIAQIIIEMLKIKEKDIDYDRNIQDYGFNSISIVDLTNKINRRFNLSLTPSIYFQYETIRLLSNHLYESFREKVIDAFLPADKIEADTQEDEVLVIPLAENLLDKKVSTSGNTMEPVKTVSVKNVREEKEENIQMAGDNEVAIIGISGVMPQSEDMEEFWNNIEKERNLISEIPLDRWDIKSFNEAMEKNGDKAICKWGGFMKEVDKFDTEFFDISPREAYVLDPQQRMFMQTVWNTIEDAGYKMSDLWDTDTGLFVGVATNDYSDVLRAFNTPIEAYTSTGASHCILANRISFMFNWHGPSEPIDTACSSSLIAIHRAAQCILNGDCNVAVAGGVNVITSPLLHMAFGKAGMLAEDGKCKTFDASANGYVRGEGCGAILLKSKAQAVKDGDHIYALIKGSAINHGGKANSLTAPNPKAQADVIMKAYKRAGFAPETVSYIEAHGTGTNLGDPVEIDGLKLAFSKMYEEEGKECDTFNYCNVGSVKPNIGHLEAAAGIAGILKVILSMKNKEIPGNIHLKNVNPFISTEQSPFRLVTKTQPWEQLHDKNGQPIPRRAGVSSFGFGGANAHIALEEYIEDRREEAVADNKKEIIVLSAKEEDTLRKRAEQLLHYLQENQSASLSDISYTLRCGREEMKERLAVVVENKEELIAELEAYINHNESHVKTGTALENSSKKAMDDDSSEKTEHFAQLYRSNKLEELAECFVNGEAVDWDAFCEENVRRVSLPGYPFKKERYWISDESPAFERTFIGVEPEEVKEVKPKESVSEPARQEPKEEASVINTERKTEDLEERLSEQTKEYLRKIISQASKMPVEKIKGDTSFEKYGIDSLMIRELNERLSKDFDDLDHTIFFEYQTLNELTDFFVKEFREQLISMFDLKQETRQQQTAVENEQEWGKTTEAETIYNQEEDIAIIGVNGKFPMADNLDEFWDNLKNGKDCIEEVPKERWDNDKYYSPKRGTPNKVNSKWGGFISDVDKFDPLFFQITPKDAEHIDPQERIFLENVYGTLEDAGYCTKTRVPRNVGVFVGVIHGHYQLLAVEETLKGNLTSLYCSYASIANRASYFFNFRGPSMAVDTMCSSSLTSLHLACESIRRGECEMAVAGGVNLTINLDKYIFLSQQRFMSSDGRCRAFGEGGDGYVPSEGVGSVLLKPLSKAEKDGDHIYAVIKGTAVNHGGKTSGYSVSNPSAQADVIMRALKKSEVDPRTINYIEAHGTGTELGDPVEIRGMIKAFGSSTTDKQFCSIGSVKSNIGHCEASAGIASITKVLLQMKHKKLVPSIHSRELNHNINFENTPFYVQQDYTDWKPVTLEENGKQVTYPRRAGISSFGAGGANVHIIMEEYIPKNKQPEEQKYNKAQDVIILSARNKQALIRNSRNLIDYLKSKSKADAPAYSTTVEKRVKAIVSGLVNINADNIDTQMDLQETGLELYQLNQLIEKLNEEFRCNFTMADMVQIHTIYQIAEWVSSKSGIQVQDAEINSMISFADLAYTLQVGRYPVEGIRVAVKVKSIPELIDSLSVYVDGDTIPSNMTEVDLRNDVQSIEEVSSKEMEEYIRNKDIDKLTQLWCHGEEVDWNRLYEPGSRHRISLPLYSFDKKRSWFTPEAPEKMSKSFFGGKKKKAEQELKPFVETSLEGKEIEDEQELKALLDNLEQGTLSVEEVERLMEV